MNHAPAPQRMMHRMKHVMTAPARTSKPMPKHRPTQAYPTYEKQDYDDHKYEWYKKPQKHEQDSSYGHKYSQKSYTPSYGNDDYEEEDDYYPEPSYGHAGPSYGHSEPSYGHSEPSYGNAYRQYKRSYDDDDYEEGGYGAYEESYDHEPSYGHEEYGDEDDGRYGSQSYEHKPSYRHRRSIDGLDTFVNAVSDGVSTTIQAHADGKKAKVDFVKGRVVLVREGQRFFLLPERPESVEEGGREAQQLWEANIAVECSRHFSTCERVAADLSSVITIATGIAGAVSFFG